MNFSTVKNELAKRFEELVSDKAMLFQVELDKDALWELYLESYPEGTNEIYRERREHDCSCCRQFVKNIGNVVVVNDDNTISSIWGYDCQDETFKVVAKAMDKFVLSHSIRDVFFSKFKKIGTDYNFEDTTKWEHFFLELPNKFVDKTNRSLGDIYGTYRDTKNVFKRSLDELTVDSIETILELIAQNSLYKGEEWQTQLSEFLKLKKEYDKLSDENKNNYTWKKATEVGAVIGRIRNHSIGTLLVNVSEGMELDLAVKKYEQIVAPTNYKRPKAIFTKKMLEDAQKTITELGYLNSLGRRFAVADDITINNVLFANRDVKLNNSLDVFEEMAKEVSVSPKKFNKCEEISIDKFISNVLPTTKEIEVLFENKHIKNLMSLIAPQSQDSQTMFKWNNNYSWSYEGNITDSDIRENVAKAGGKVDGVLRFSIQWNDTKAHNACDYDAHCITPNRTHIHYANKLDGYTEGNLDVDIVNPIHSTPAVENITFPTKTKLLKGEYLFIVHGFSIRSGNEGFSAEIEMDGEIFNFEYNKPLKQNESVKVATVKFDGEKFTIQELLPSTTSSKKIWDIPTQQFVPVSMVMYSPNYWDEQKKIGNKHYFFMIKDCINPNNPNGFYNEFLKEELSKHKRVFEALGSKMKVEDCDSQLSGVGFSSTQRNEVIVKVKGATERVLKIKI